MSQPPPPPPMPASSGPSPGQPPVYGTTVPTAYGGQPMRNGMGIAALVLGILSIVGSIFLIGVVLGVLAIIFGILGRKRANRGEADNGGMALAGVITGIVGTLISAAVIVVTVWVVTSDEFEDFNDCMRSAVEQAEADQCADDFGRSLTD